MKRFVFFTMFIFLLGNLGFSQGTFVVQNKRQTSKIKFKLINNLVIVPVEINGVVLSFLLDTGVSKPIIFNFLNLSDTLKIKDTETIFLRGLGEGESIKALRSKNNIFKIGNALKLNQDLYAVYDNKLNLAPRLGVPVHGIIGYDLFKDLVVEINYSGKYLKLTNPKKYQYKKCKKCTILNLEFYNNKPYINAEIRVNEKNIPIKLLIDSGGSDALWLFEDDSLGIKSKPAFFYDFLGYGLSGSVYGKRSVIDAFLINSFVLENANVAYPDDSYMSSAKHFKDRNGTLAGNILKRFNMIVNYQKATITLKRNSYFNEKFSYNRSGIELAHDGVRLVREKDNKILNEKSGLTQNEEDLNRNRIVLDTHFKLSLKPAYSIVELRKDSPAFNAGLMINDVVLSINGKPAHEFSLQQIIHMFYGDDGNRIKLKVDRNGKDLTFNFILKSPLK
ncbi:MAG: hypothetical protein ACI9OE_002265 [Mariniflexile sp.]|jgi:hypothetical protein